MLDLNNKKVVRKEIKRVINEMRTATGTLTIAILKEDLEYLESKLK
jgi:hypothetical protein